MGYTKSKKVLEEVRPILDVVLAAKGVRVNYPSRWPTKLAMRIREGLKSAEDFEEENRYAEILLQYKIRVKSDKIVFDPRAIVTYENPVLELAQSLNALEIPKVNSIIEVVGACIKHKAPRIVFPDAQLSETDIARLSSWCNNNEYLIEQLIPLFLKKNGRTKPADSDEENSTSKHG